ncbi:NADP-dependent oxidoreductase [Ktedonobacter racemifer]|uniref:Alcohol dehydrogenase zinc-binding domain protein n=1 Tax=Ktedonobacter racemifer DSM 44963 TaxID=485913 RepID=D6TWD2_KTERA|nr:NADP-dependent oxidoreductase [Ktedonobacter racemifer]EFH84515.1 Alcohol dehydrogenase zinc-binding domain protein [Ktedonobacter racemifer DSM 44963]
MIDKGQRIQAIAITAFGGPDQLKLVDLPVPPCGPEQVLISVQAAGVGMWDVKVRQGSVVLEGQQFPLVLGWESAGIIAKVGEAVTGWDVGTHVICTTYQVGIGHYASAVAVPANLVAPMPSSLDALHAAALPVNGLTAYQAIFELLKIQPGETLLITGAAGGTGTFAVQLAARVGAHVMVTARSEHHPYLQQLGASELIDYTQTDFAEAVHAAHPEGIDAVLDCVGGETAARSMQVVRERGRLVTIVDLEQVTPTRHIDTHVLYFRPDGRQLAELTKLVDHGQLTVHLDQVFPLVMAKQAHERLETRHHQGKIVLNVPG